MWTTWSCNTIAKGNYLFIFLYSLLLLSAAWLLLCTYAAVGTELLCCLQAGDRQLGALDLTLRQELCNKWTTTIQNFNHQQQYHLVHLPRRWSALCAAAALNFQPVRWNRQIFMSWFEGGVVSFHQSMGISTLETCLALKRGGFFFGCVVWFMVAVPEMNI